MARHCQNARGVVDYLRGHDRVARVHYPEFGAIVSFELEAGVDETIAFTKRLQLWTLAESLGSVKSLFCHPPTMTHASVEPEVRRRVGIADGLIRLSVGLEDVRDLIDDLDQSLSEVSSPRRIACAG
jgi:cystathionine beta-lyase/cystathionine gamma-synthase